MILPKNNDAVITTCFNCDMEFETIQKIGSWMNCNEDDEGCGFICKLIDTTGRIETE